MRKIIVLFVFLIYSFVSSQNKQVLYNFTEIPQSMLTNPGLDVKYQWYMGIPLFSGFSIRVNSTFASPYDVWGMNDIDFNTKIRNVLYNTSRNDHAYFNQQWEILNGGFKIMRPENDLYLSFGLYQELDAIGYVPRDIPYLIFDGNIPHLDKTFKFGDINGNLDLLTVFHIGAHKKIIKNLTVGARAKLYSSIINIHTSNNSGFFYTIPSENSKYQQVVAADITVHTAGITPYLDNITQEAVINDLFSRSLLMGNRGLGLDVGFTYNVKDNIQITGSMIDFGFINHKKETETFSVNGKYVYGGTVATDDREEINNPYLAVRESFPIVRTINPYRTLRPIKFNASVQYSYNELDLRECNCQGFSAGKHYKNTLGAHFFTMTTLQTPIVALTGYFMHRISKTF
jgi:hypothetical protein